MCGRLCHGNEEEKVSLGKSGGGELMPTSPCVHWQNGACPAGRAVSLLWVLSPSFSPELLLFTLQQTWDL